jgi:hypothetical protein
LPSHGASATVIATEPGRTLLLSCAHAFEGADLHKPIVIDVPTSHPLSPQAAGVVVLRVDYAADLSLLQLRAGPVDFAAPVAPQPPGAPTHLLSVGYDGMRLPAIQTSAHLLSQSGSTTYTVERPGHGRSGGALLDLDTGCLVGVVQGYEVTGWRRGMYVSLNEIHRFLAEGNTERGSGSREWGIGNRYPYSLLPTPYSLFSCPT